MEHIADLTGKEFPISNEILAGYLPENATLSEAANHIKSLLTTNSVSPDIKQALLKSDDFHKTLRMLMHTDWTLSADELTEKDAVANLYRRIDEQIDRLKSLADNTTGSASAKLSADLGQTKQNMNFMNDMNQMYNFVELPIRMNGQTATGDLYVYSDKHRRRTSDGNGISCLLHLDMAKQGFNPKSEVVKTTDKEDEKKLKSGGFNLVNDFIPSEIERNNYSRYTFDMRA